MVQYPTDALEKLEKIKCLECEKKINYWDDEIYRAWIKYVNGENRSNLIKNTRFSSRLSLQYHFKHHKCYKKISLARKRFFRSIKTKVKDPVTNYPWLLGFYYADGFLRTNKTQAAFVISKHEFLIGNRIESELYKILDGDVHIAIDKIGNMTQIRLHSRELCKNLPSKKNENEFTDLWKKFNDNAKLNFISGFVDGDGCCQFETGINSITIYSKVVPFLLPIFESFLSQFGYVSRKNYSLYLSPNVGKVIKPFTVKKDVKIPYSGSVNVELAFTLLKQGYSTRQISKKIGKDRKTITLALKRIYGIEKIQTFLDRKNKKLKLIQ